MRLGDLPKVIWLVMGKEKFQTKVDNVHLFISEADDG